MESAMEPDPTTAAPSQVAAGAVKIAVVANGSRTQFGAEPSNAEPSTRTASAKGSSAAGGTEGSYHGRPPTGESDVGTSAASELQLSPFTRSMDCPASGLSWRSRFAPTGGASAAASATSTPPVTGVTAMNAARAGPSARRFTGGDVREGCTLPMLELAMSESQSQTADSRTDGRFTAQRLCSLDNCGAAAAAAAAAAAVDGGYASGTGSGAPHSSTSWVDTDTLWNAVQDQELQRQQRLAQELTKPSRMACPFRGKACTIKAAWRPLAQRIRTQLVIMSRVAVKDPYTVIIPLILLMFLLAFGLWGVMSVSYAMRDGRRQAALNAAVDYSKALTDHIAATVAPASTVKTLIELDPDWPSINATFHAVAPKLIEKGKQMTAAILTMVLVPQGIVSAIVPTGLPDWAPVYGLDLLRNNSWRADALKAVALHEEGMVMSGPSRLRAGMMGIVCRYAVFIEGAGPNETFGAPGSAYECAPCYEPPTATATGSRFWGFAQLNVDWEILTRNTTKVYDLCERDNLHFNMTYIDPVTHVNRSIASCGNMDPNPVYVEIQTMHNRWVLAVSDARGWTPDWLPVVVAVVVIMSLWVAAAMAVILINRREHMWLLQAMLPKKVIATLRRGEDYAEAFECVTVLFSDIVSYTNLASGMEPLKVVRLLNEMYSEFDALVDQYDCFKVETIGDAFMAVCGTQGEDAVTAAVKMARLAQGMVERTRVLVSADGQKIQIRIGLHSGPVVGAVVGFKMPHFCLCGDTVNTASRVETTSKPMRIQVSESTAALLRASGAGFRLEPRGPVEMKGKGAMHTQWLLPDEPAGAAAEAGAAAAAVAAAAAPKVPPLVPSTSGAAAVGVRAPTSGAAGLRDGGSGRGGGGAKAWEGACGGEVRVEAEAMAAEAGNRMAGGSGGSAAAGTAGSAAAGGSGAATPNGMCRLANRTDDVASEWARSSMGRSSRGSGLVPANSWGTLALGIATTTSPNAAGSEAGGGGGKAEHLSVVGTVGSGRGSKKSRTGSVDLRLFQLPAAAARKPAGGTGGSKDANGI